MFSLLYGERYNFLSHYLQSEIRGRFHNELLWPVQEAFSVANLNTHKQFIAAISCFIDSHSCLTRYYEGKLQDVYKRQVHGFIIFTFLYSARIFDLNREFLAERLCAALIRRTAFKHLLPTPVPRTRKWQEIKFFFLFSHRGIELLTAAALHFQSKFKDTRREAQDQVSKFINKIDTKFGCINQINITELHFCNVRQPNTYRKQ